MPPFHSSFNASSSHFHVMLQNISFYSTLCIRITMDIVSSYSTRHSLPPYLLSPSHSTYHFVPHNTTSAYIFSHHFCSPHTDPHTSHSTQLTNQPSPASHHQDHLNEYEPFLCTPIHFVFINHGAILMSLRPISFHFALQRCSSRLAYFTSVSLVCISNITAAAPSTPATPRFHHRWLSLHLDVHTRF